MDQQRKWQRAFKLVLLLLGMFSVHAQQSDLTGRLKVCNICSSSKFKVGTVYAIAAFESVQQVVTGTNSSVPSYRATTTYNERADTATVFALGSCAPSLQIGDCTSCLRYVSGLLWTTCGNSFGGRYLTRDCYLRYEAYPFEEPGRGLTGAAAEPCTLANPNPRPFF